MPSLFPLKFSLPFTRIFRQASRRCTSFQSLTLSGAVLGGAVLGGTVLGGTVLVSALLPSRSPLAQAQAQTKVVLNPELRVGIVQRFGEKATDKLLIKALPGDQLKLSFQNKDQTQSISANQVEFDIQVKPLAKPVIDRKVVISTHRSFESAEAKADQLRTQGIQVELAQPNQWQVWGKRDFYVTEQNQIWLLNQVKERGFPHAFIQTKTVTQKPQLSWSSNGYRYHRDNVTIESGNRQFLVGSDRFAGQLNFQPNTYGTYTLVNQTPIETYLRGVVPYEIGPKAPTTAVQAQSIIARTYALRNLRRFKIDNYEMCATTQCQVFKGLDASTPQVDAAIAATTGRVLTYNNELVDALYSSTTGGVTAQFEDVWEGQSRPYLQSKIDAVPNQIWNLTAKPLSDEKNFRAFINLNQGFNEETWDYFRWVQESPIQQINKNLKDFLKAEKHPLANFTQVQNLQVTGRSLGGRVQQLTVSTDVGQIVLKKDEILRAFEAPNSLLFYLDPKFESVTPQATTSSPATATASKPAKNVVEMKLVGVKFTGGGLGHAVGLSQTGSYRLSDIGYSADQILKFYYPGTSIVPLTQSIVYWKGPETTLTAQTSNRQDSPQNPTPEISSAQTSAASSEPLSPGEKPPSAAKAAPEQPERSFFGIPLPEIDFSVLWEWIPFI